MDIKQYATEEWLDHRINKKGDQEIQRNKLEWKYSISKLLWNGKSGNKRSVYIITRYSQKTGMSPNNLIFA